MQLAPAAFLGHGSPMNTLETNRHTKAWQRFGEVCGKPRAVLMVSAHWYTNATAVTAMARPRTIHDFYGFPAELSEFQYPAPGSPELAEEVAEAVLPERIGLDGGTWGLDHGAWSVLAHAFPEADVPVVQLSINALKPFDYHMEIAARLAPLRERGIVIVGSGNLVHNLRALEWGRPDEGFDWARRFDERTRQVMAESPSDIARLQRDPDFKRVAPTPDHFIPLLYIAALAGKSGCGVDVITQGYAFGSVSMTAFALGAPESVSHQAELGRPSETSASLPPEQTNL